MSHSWVKLYSVATFWVQQCWPPSHAHCVVKHISLNSYSFYRMLLMIVKLRTTYTNVVYINFKISSFSLVWECSSYDCLSHLAKLCKLYVVHSCVRWSRRWKLQQLRLHCSWTCSIVACVAKPVRRYCVFFYSTGLSNPVPDMPRRQPLSENGEYLNNCCAQVTVLWY